MADNQKLTCPICGEPTHVYFGNARKDRLCPKHGKMAKNGEIVLDPHGRWREAATKNVLSQAAQQTKETPIPQKRWWEVNNSDTKTDVEPKIQETKLEQETTEETLKTIIIDKTIRCLTCGFETDGKLFCKKCYAKYCEKEILIKIKNCKEIIPLDDFYEGYYECDDGHVVKSMAERDIDDYLFAHNIKHGYETALPLTDDKGKRITLHPDFCIFDDHSKPLYYIEYWGYDDSNRDYTKTKKFKMPLYEKAGITLININAKHDLRNLKTNLQYKLENFKMGQINFTNE